MSALRDAQEITGRIYFSGQSGNNGTDLFFRAINPPFFIQPFFLPHREVEQRITL
jgi:hypothetical protein